MIVLKCKMCGGALDIQDGATVCECEYCGSKQTVPNADNEKKLNLFVRANRLRAGNEFDKAAGVYESIVADFPEEAEAYWGLILCKYGIEYVDDPGTGKKIPTCHRSSFDSVMDDSNFELVMEYADPIARRMYREEAKQIEDLRKDIIEVSSKEEPYDIFICYKESAEDGQRTIDSVLAQDIYDMLTENGYRVFFSRVSLEDKLGVEYEPYIFAALNSAKIMLAVGTDYDYYNAVWVKNEWSRFLQLIAKGEKKTLIPCYKNIDAYDIPKEFAKLQAQDLGKVGAMQDLLRGIKKILPKKADPQNNTEAKTANQTETFLRRVFLLLEDEEWEKADNLCEQVLNQEPENAQAYLGKLMAELHVSKQSDLGCYGKRYSTNSNYKNALRFCDVELRDTLEQYVAKNDANLLSTPIEAFEFESTDLGCTVKKLLDQQLTEIVIPKNYYEMPVTVIGEEAFWFCRNLTSVTIPNSVNYIGDKAFDCCKSLTSVSIPNSVISIGNEAFSSCEGLTNITIPDSVTTIGNGAFSDCKNLVSIQIPDNVTSIGNYAFSNCKSLTSVSIPDSVTSIGEGAFMECYSLANITIPNSVTSIGNGAFNECRKLADENGFVIFRNVLYSYCHSTERVSIPDNVTSIGDYAFSDCGSLVSVSIPNSVTSIGEGAFMECYSLTNILIPNSVTSIGKRAFLECEKLADENGFVIFRGVLYSYCHSDKHVTIPNSVISIGNEAFFSCEDLANVSIPDSVISIGSEAFACCKNLTSVTIPDSVTSIEDGAFRGCKSLTSITIPNSVNSIKDLTFYECYSLASITIPNSVSSIGYSAFNRCRNLTSVTIPDSVTSIGNGAFSDCQDLKTIICPGDYEKLRSVFLKNNANDKDIFACLEQGAKEMQKLRAEKERRALLEFRQTNGLCIYCGGTFKKSLLSTKCTNCGRKKDY